MHKVANKISKELNTKVAIQNVDFDLFNKMHINGILIEDRKKDTLVYAGEAKVDITDWFFLKDSAVLHYISLKDALVNLKRTDSVWNYQFIADYFGGGKKSGSSKKGIEFDFKKIDVENITINKVDSWIGKDIYVKIGKGEIDANKIDLANKKININTIALTTPSFTEYRYTGNKSKLNLPPAINTTITAPSQFQWNNDGWVVNVAEIKIDNGNVKIEKDTERQRYTNMFDGQHLLFEKLNGSFKNLVFEKDTVTTIVSLKTKEQSGFEIKKLAANLKLTPSIMEFNNLDLITNKSHLKNYYSMSYSDFSGDFGDYIHAVNMNGHFTDSELSSDDLAFFAPKAKAWNRTFYIDGKANGTVDNLRATQMHIKAGSTILDGNLIMRGLPDIEETFIDLKSNTLQTNSNDLSVFVPTLKNVKQLNKLGTINFKGNFTGFINDFVTYGTTETNLGTVTADVNMKLPQGKPAIYQGKINTTAFNLGKLLDDNKFGNIAINGTINGSGFSRKELKTSFKGDVKKIYLSGYEYQNIAIDGNFEKDIFKGLVNVDDPNLKIKNLDGVVSLAQNKPQYKFSALLQKASLKNLKLTNEEFTLDGTFNLNFSGNNLDNFLGSAKVYDAKLFSKDKKLSFDYLALQSSINKDGTKQLLFETNEMDGNINGKFKIAELPDAFKLFLNKYYPSYVKKPTKKVSQQDFTFNINTKNIDGYTQLIDKKLNGFNNSVINGSLQLSTNTLSIDADVPSFSYDGKIFTGTHLVSNGTLDSLSTDITINEISINNDSLKFPATKLSIHTSNDASHVSITTSASKTLNQASLNAVVKTMADGVSIDFEPSSVIINDNKWELEKQGNLTLNKKSVSANEIKFVNGEQEIVISTRLPPEGEQTELVANLKKVHIDDFATMFIKKPKLEGTLTGELTVGNMFTKPSVNFKGDAQKFSLDGREIGDTKLVVDYDSKEDIVTVDTKTESEKNSFTISGQYKIKDSTDEQMMFNIEASKFDLNTLEPYIAGIFSDVEGSVLYNGKISGNKKRQYLTGIVTADSASLKVNFTQCKYKLGFTEIHLNKDEIDFGSLTLKDELGNKATASGKLYHTMFNDFYFDNIAFKVNNAQSNIPGTGKFLVLNTTKKDNSSFYGRVIGDANTTMSLNGPVTDMKMDIEGAPSKIDSSYIKLLTGAGKDGGKIDYIDFIQFGKKMDESFLSSKAANIVVNLNMHANPACKIDVVLDEETGDVIKGEGNGDLLIKAGNKENITMNGTYEITKGSYNFNFQTFLDKDFVITKGSKISWNGNPYDAQINIDALYKASGVNLNALTSISGKEVGQKDKLNIIVHLTNTLKQPDINFEFQLPEDNQYKNDQIVLENLKKFQQDKNEMNKQVFSLLMFNTFFNNGSELKNSLPNFLGGTVGQMLSSYLNNILVKVFKNSAATPYFNFNTTYDGSVSPEFIKSLQASGTTGLSWQLLNGRLRVALGGNFDVNNPYLPKFRNSNVLLTPDITVEWLLSKDGRWRLVGFNRTNIDQTYGQRNKTGVKISHHNEFDKKRKPKIKK